ncbi:MAG: gliding motility-associated ABC transporter ATP-binding subunit GldA [Ferruginibacter sp.]
MSLLLQDITKKYDTQIAVNNIRFNVGFPEIVGFLGPNGAGKSTTLKMITGYLQPDQGTIEVCGMDISQHPIESRRKIGYLPESNPLYTDMYVREYLAFVAGLYQLREKQKRLNEVIELTGLGTEAHKKIGQLSKGFKQRVGLSAAIIHNPDVLILDEPTTGLDPNQIIEIRNVIQSLAETKTVLFSSHILQEVEALCKRVIIINNGHIVADDKLEQLKAAGSKNATVLLTIKQSIRADELAQLIGMGAIIKTGDQTFELACDNPDIARKKIMEAALAHSLDILQLQTEEQNLEQIFKSLTNYHTSNPS